MWELYHIVGFMYNIVCVFLVILPMPFLRWAKIRPKIKIKAFIKISSCVFVVYRSAALR